MSKVQRRKGKANRSGHVQSMTTAIIRANKIVDPEPLRFNSTLTADVFTQWRFVVAGALPLVNYIIRAQDVLSQFLMCYAATAISVSGYPIFSRFLYKSIRLLGTQTTTSLRFVDNAGTALNSEKTSSDSSDSADRYAVSKISPRPNQQAGQWQNFISTSGSFTISCSVPMQCTLEVHVVAQINNGGDPSEGVLVFNSNPGIVLGQVFSPTLDVSGDALGYVRRVGFVSVSDLVTVTPRP